MSKFVVVTFPDETKAYQGVSALNELHGEGSITLYGTLVVERGADGKLITKQRTSEAAIGVGLGSLFGALVGVFGGPVGVAVGLAAGGTVGGLGGYVHGQVSDEFLEDVTGAMNAGTFAVLAEVSEPWTAPIDARMAPLGGKVLRENREDAVDDLIEKRVEARRAYLDEKKVARQTRKAEKMQAHLDEDIADARDKLQRTADKARIRLDETKKELLEKLRTLEEQAARAKPGTKEQIEERIAEIRKDFAEREQKLAHAWEVAQEALQP